MLIVSQDIAIIHTFSPPSGNSLHVCSIYTVWNESPVEEKSSMDERAEQKYLEQGSISTACRVNLANLYKLTRGDDGYQFPLLRTNVFQKQ